MKTRFMTFWFLASLLTTSFAQGPVYNFNFNNGEVKAPIQTNSGAVIGEPKVLTEEKATPAQPPLLAAKSQSPFDDFFKPDSESLSLGIEISVQQESDKKQVIASDFSFKGTDKKYGPSDYKGFSTMSGPLTSLGLRIPIGSSFFITPSATLQKYTFRALDKTAYKGQKVINASMEQLAAESVYGGMLEAGLVIRVFKRLRISLSGFYGQQKFDTLIEDNNEFSFFAETYGAKIGPVLKITDRLSLKAQAIYQTQKINYEGGAKDEFQEIVDPIEGKSKKGFFSNSISLALNF